MLDKSKLNKHASKASQSVTPINKNAAKRAETVQWMHLIDSNNLEDKSFTTENSKAVISYISTEFTALKNHTDRVIGSQFNLRKAAYYLNIGGYKALGFKSFKACLEKEFPKKKSLSKLYREAEAARLEKLLLPNKPIGSVKESVLRPLSKLKNDENICKAWKEAMNEKSEKASYPTAKGVKKVLNKQLSIKTEEKDLPWKNECANKIAKTVAHKLEKELAKYNKKNTTDRVDKILKLSRKYVIDKLTVKAE